MGWAGFVAALLVTGCSRQYYRRDADEQAYCLIQEKEAPAWNLGNFSIYMDPRSRYFDPYEPDRPPMPPDDPASHEIMHGVYGMKGSKRWHENGDITDLENPGWQQYLGELMPRDKNGRYMMRLEDAAQFALMNSPSYHRNIEDIYLSALDVASERFRFQTQFYGGTAVTYRASGPETPGGSSSTLSQQNYLSNGPTIAGAPPRFDPTGSGIRGSSGQAGMQKLFPWGGELLASFANTFVWQFAGPNQTVRADSVLSFTFLQPLLRGAGRQVVMERLTVAERVLLSNLREMERYRHLFLTDVAFGTGATGGPQRRGGLFGGSGLAGFTGTGGGGFGGVGETAGFNGRAVTGGAAGAGGGAGAGFAGGVASNVSGFYGLVQQASQLQNRESNLTAQVQNLQRIEALFAAGRIDSLQVDQARQNVQTTRSQYLNSQVQSRDSVESYLTRTLGLPPNIAVRLDESVLATFQFTDPRLTRVQAAVTDLLDRVRTTEHPSREDVDKRLQEVDGLSQPIAERFETVLSDIQKMDSVRERRRAILRTDAERQTFLRQVESLKNQYQVIETRFAQVYQDFAGLRRELGTLPPEEAHRQLAEHLDALSELLLELPLVQAGVRLESVVIEPVRLEAERALGIALANRLDLMDQRAALVDQWRLITFNANRLKSDLDVVFSGDISTIDHNIAKFRGEAGNLSVGLRFDLPIERLEERNLYRQSLIDYQRARRGYIQTEDAIHTTMITLIRRLQQFEEEMELRRSGMRIAIRTVDQTQEALRRPPAVSRTGAAATSLGPTAVRDLLSALSDLLSTQDSVLSTYLNYQLLRMQLYRDLGLIRFDSRGVWIDEPLGDALHGAAVEEPFVPPDIPNGSPRENGQETGPEPVPAPPPAEAGALRAPLPDAASRRADDSSLPPAPRDEPAEPEGPGPELLPSDETPAAPSEDTGWPDLDAKRRVPQQPITPVGWREHPTDWKPPAPAPVATARSKPATLWDKIRR